MACIQQVESALLWITSKATTACLDIANKRLTWVMKTHRKGKLVHATVALWYHIIHRLIIVS